MFTFTVALIKSPLKVLLDLVFQVVSLLPSAIVVTSLLIHLVVNPLLGL